VLPWLLALLTGLGLLSAVNALLLRGRAARRAAGVALPPEEPALQSGLNLPAQIFIDRQVPGGPSPGGRTADRVSLLASARRLRLASGHGRLVEISAERPGEVRSPGPRRLVVEGAHPSGEARVRVELVVDGAEAWVARAAGWR
jgi:hypothetical protein